MVEFESTVGQQVEGKQCIANSILRHWKGGNAKKNIQIQTISENNFFEPDNESLKVMKLVGSWRHFSVEGTIKNCIIIIFLWLNFWEVSNAGFQELCWPLFCSNYANWSIRLVQRPYFNPVISDTRGQNIYLKFWNSNWYQTWEFCYNLESFYHSIHSQMLKHKQLESRFMQR